MAQLPRRTRAMNLLQELVVNAPEDLRQELRSLATVEMARRCSRMRLSGTQDTEHRATVMALRSASRRVLAQTDEADELEAEREAIVSRVAPRLLAEFGVGVVTGAQILCACLTPVGSAPRPPSPRWPAQHQSRRRPARPCATASTEAATASSTAPCTPRFCRAFRSHPETQAYAARRTEEEGPTRD